MATKRNLAAEAEKLIAQGKLEAAAIKYEQLVRANPRDLNTLNKIGDIYARVGKKREAIAHFRRLCEAYEKDGFLPKAIAIYKKIIKIDARDLEACRRLAEIQAEQGLVNEARANFMILLGTLEALQDIDGMIAVRRSLVNLQPEVVETHLALADLLATFEHRGEEAAEVYAGAGAELDRQGRHEEARHVYKKASRFKPGSPDIAARLATSHVAAGDIDTGISLLRGTLETAGEDIDLLALLADFHVQAGQRKDAEEVLRRAVALSPERVDLAVRFGRLLLALGDPRAAFSALQPGLGGVNGDADLKQVTGLLDDIVTTEGFPPEAAEALLMLFDRMRDRKVVAIRGKGLIDRMRQMGNNRLAKRLAGRLTALRPDDRFLARDLADLVGRDEVEDLSAAPTNPATSEADAAGRDGGGPPRGAIEPTMAAALGLPEIPDLSREDTDFISEHMTEADVFVKYGLPDRAVEQLMIVVERYPAHLPALVRLKELHLEEGQREEARKAMSWVVKAHLAVGDRFAAEEQMAELRRYDPSSSELVEIEKALHIEAQPIREPMAPPSAGQGGEESEEFEIEFEEEGHEEMEQTQKNPAVQQVHAGASADPPRVPEPGSGEGLLDLASEIDAVLGAVVPDQVAEETQDPESLEEMISAFRENVEKEVAEDDAETHYNLGIAFKEMGLTDEAIGEFQVAARDPGFLPNSCSMLGLCFREKGLSDQAVKWYRKGLTSAADPDSESILGLRYDLAELLMEQGQLEEALALFSEIFGSNSKFREVKSRLKEVEAALAN